MGAKVRVLRHQPLNKTTIFPPPGRWKLKRAINKTKHRTTDQSSLLYGAFLRHGNEISF
jgi:hypothetical protein